MADVFSEVDEELRKERYEILWKSYGKYVIGIASLIIIAVAGTVGWREYMTAKYASESGRFEAALRLTSSDDRDRGAQAFSALADDASVGYRVLAKLQYAQTLMVKGEYSMAISVYDSLQSDNELDQNMKDFARLLASQALLKLGDPNSVESLEKRLKPLLDVGNSWRFSAGEVAGALALKAGNLEVARRKFKALADDQMAPNGIRERAYEVWMALSSGA